MRGKIIEKYEELRILDSTKLSIFMNEYDDFMQRGGTSIKKIEKKYNRNEMEALISIESIHRINTLE